MATNETSLQMFRRIVRQFASDTDEEINCWLRDAAEFLCASSFGSSYPRAIVLYAGHLRAMAELSALQASGGIGAALAFGGLASSIKEGDLSISLRAGSGNANADDMVDDELSMTLYGRMFASLRDSVAPGFVVINARIPRVR